MRWLCKPGKRGQYLHVAPYESQCSKAGDLVSKTGWRGSIPRGFAISSLMITQIKDLYGVLVKYGLSRLPVTQKITGSNPVYPATKLTCECECNW